MKRMKKKVLVIEQNHSLGFVIRTVLNESFLVEIVSNAFDAMELLTQKEIDCIILGVEKEISQSQLFLQHLKSSSLLKDTPIVVITDQDVSFIDFWEKMGVSKVFKKPFDPLKLLDYVQAICSPIDTTQIIFKKRKILNLN